jgi:hypothetical protein
MSRSSRGRRIIKYRKKNKEFFEIRKREGEETT